MTTATTSNEFKDAINGKLSRYFGVSLSEATKDQIYKAVVMTVRDILLEKRNAFHYKIGRASCRERVLRAV